MALSGQADDLFLGFHQSGNTTTDYVIDLGPASIFRDANTTLTLTLTGLNTDMAAAFSPSTTNWKTSGDISWGIAASPGAGDIGTDLARTIYVSSPLGQTPTAIGSQSGPSNNVGTFKNYWNTLTAGSVNQTVGGVGTIIGAIGNPGNAASWTHYAGISFGDSNNIAQFDSSLGSSFELFRLPQTTDQAQVKDEGKFTFNIGAGSNNSSIVFTPNVPEPTTGALLCVALVSFAARRQRRSHLA